MTVRPGIQSCLRLLATALALAGTVPAQAQTPIPMRIGVPENNPLALGSQQVLQQAYAKLGLRLQARPLPLRRALQMAESGELDGDLMRSAAALEANGKLLKIDVPVGRVVAAAYQRGECPASISVAELASKRVSYFRGTRFVELLLPAESLVEANDNWDALRRLQHGLSDYALDVALVSDITLIRHGVTNICKIPEPVLVVPLFHALHRRHAALAPKLEKTLQAMQKRGEIAAIWEAVEKQQREAAHEHGRLKLPP